MRKLSLLASLVFASSIANADLGAISVKSFLYQALKATIPINNVADGDYNNLTINLADSSQFARYGVEYNSDLGLLQFRVVNNGNVHYLQITSSKPISAPVLNILLHYRENENDFYKQYTVLLNPIKYSSVGYENQQNSVGARTTPIGIGSAVAAQKRKIAAQKALKPTSKFVQEYLNRYDPTNLTFRMESGDTLYIPIKFTQELYPKSNLKTNQIAVALGLVNYPSLHNKNYVYESTTIINMASAKQVSALPVADADQYVWRSDMDTVSRQIALDKLADKLQVKINANDSNLFDGTAVVSTDNDTEQTSQDNDAGKVDSSKAIASNSAASNVVASKVTSSAVKKPAYVPPPVYTEPSIFDMLEDYLYEIVGAVVLLLLLAMFTIRKKRAKKIKTLNADHKSAVQQQLEERELAQEIIFDDLPVQKPQVTKAVAVENHVHVEPEVELATETIKAEPVIENQTLEFNAPVNVEPSVKPAAQNHEFDEIISQLEMILSMEEGRNDIKFKLLELNLESGNLAKAQEWYQDLEDSLDFDDKLRQSLLSLAEKHNLKTNKSAASLPRIETVEPVVTHVDNVVETSHNFEIDEAHSINFDSSFTNNVEELSLSEPIEEISNDDLLLNKPTDILDAATLSNDDLISTAVQHCLSEDYSTAKGLLLDVLNSDDATAEQKDSVHKLMEFYKLNG
jgi:hypothetical protein